MVINYLAVLVCAIVSMIVGFVWYGPLFGKMWMQIMGVETMSMEEKQAMKNNMYSMYGIQFVLSLITIGTLDYFILNSPTNSSGLAVAICLWFGFVMTTDAGAALWSGKPRSTAWKMFLLSAGAQLVSFILFGLILGAWGI